MRTTVLAGTLLVVSVAVPGCATPADRAARTETITGAPIGASGLTPDEIQAEVMSFTRSYLAVVTQAFDELELDDDSMETRRLAARGRTSFATNAVEIATGRNPVTALIDMTVMVTLQRRVWDDYWRPVRFPDDGGERFGRRLAVLEEQIWAIAAEVLDEQALGALHDIIDDVRNRYPDQVYVSSLRMSDFAEARSESLVRVPGGNSLLALFGLDPMANLSPATRQLAESRLLAERGFFYASTLPYLLSWQVREITLESLADPDVQRVVAAAEQAGSASERAAGVAEDLAARLSDERAAAIDQLADRVFEGLAREREALLTRIAEEQDGLRTTLGELSATVEAATALSESLRPTIAESTTLMEGLERFKNPDARPFDVTEFESATVAATEAIRELQATLTTASAMVTEISADDSNVRTVIDEGTSSMHALVDRIFVRGLVLVGAAALCLLAVLVVHRRLGRAAA